MRWRVSFIPTGPQKKNKAERTSFSNRLREVLFNQKKLIEIFKKNKIETKYKFQYDHFIKSLEK